MKKLFKRKNPVGRPRLNPKDRKTYQRIAVAPETYRVIKKRTEKDDTSIMEYLDYLVKQDNN